MGTEYFCSTRLRLRGQKAESGIIQRLIHTLSDTWAQKTQQLGSGICLCLLWHHHMGPLSQLPQVSQPPTAGINQMAIWDLASEVSLLLGSCVDSICWKQVTQGGTHSRRGEFNSTFWRRNVRIGKHCLQTITSSNGSLVSCPLPSQHCSL